VTIYTPTIKGGPAGDLGLGAFAAVIRHAYATGDGLDSPADTDEDRLERFAAFLLGAGAPSDAVADYLAPPPPDDDELIYVFVGGERATAKLEARRRGLGDTWRWRHVANADDVTRELAGFDPTDLVIVELEALAQGTLDDALAAYRPTTDVDTGGRL
jgi:hypothetical protein